MQFSDLKSFIIEMEGLHLTAYKCPAGILTIGVGHTNGVKIGDLITKEQAMQFLDSDIRIAKAQVIRLVKPKLEPHQLDALTDFVFNLGVAKFKSSTLLKCINEGRMYDVPTQLKRWIYADGKVLNGLVRRRNLEAQIWESGFPIEG